MRAPRGPGLCAAGTASVAPPAGVGPDGPPPAMQQPMGDARTAAHTAAMNALTLYHQTAINAIVGNVQAGHTTDPRDAAKQIDTLLTPKESAAVLPATPASRSSCSASTVTR